jgi:hypothetical protein
LGSRWFPSLWALEIKNAPCPRSIGGAWRAFPNSPARGHSCNPRPHAREEADPTAQPRALSASGRRRRREPDADCALRDKMLHEGIEEHAIAGVTVPMYSVPKTVVDLFRYRQSAGKRYKKSPSLNLFRCSNLCHVPIRDSDNDHWLFRDLHVSSVRLAVTVKRVLWPRLRGITLEGLEPLCVAKKSARPPHEPAAPISAIISLSRLIVRHAVPTGKSGGQSEEASTD